MHSIQRAGPATRAAAPAGDMLDLVCGFFEGRVAALEAAGIDRARLVLDPGMGFFLGDTPAPSIDVLRRLGELKRRLALPVLVSVSRKSFLRALTGQGMEDIGPATLAAELYAADQGADYIRTHDAKALADGLAIWRALATQG